MTTCALYRFHSEFSQSFPRMSIIPKTTPVHRLEAIAKTWRHNGIYIKREDQTDSVYGGNKVRNLEFIFGHAVARGHKQLFTVAPMGSNFIAALCAQAKKFDFHVEVAHFVPAHSEQMQAHWEFTNQTGAQFNIYPGFWGSVPAFIHARIRHRLSLIRGPFSQWVSPGGSSITGAIGHVNALLEFEEQVRNDEVPDPSVIVLGAGTCGTMAGILAAHRLISKERRIVGVRCVDRIVCNRFAIANLANATLKHLGSERRIHAREIELISPQKDQGYGNVSDMTRHVAREFYAREGIVLDTTYTSKVVLALKDMVTSGDIGKNDRVLYWHTFSGKHTTRPGVGLDPERSSANP